MLASGIRIRSLALALFAVFPLAEGRAARSRRSSDPALTRRDSVETWPEVPWATPPGDPDKPGIVHTELYSKDYYVNIPSGYIRCGQSWQTADYEDVWGMLRSWPLPTDPEFGQKFMYLPPHTCTRTACFGTSGVYLCNSRNHTLMLETAFNASWAMKAVKYLRSPPSGTLRTQTTWGCCDDVEKNSGRAGFSSEWRSTGPNGVPGWLSIIGYANCNDDRISPYPGGGPGKWDGKGRPYNGRCHQLQPGNWPNTEHDVANDTGYRFPPMEGGVKTSELTHQDWWD